MKYKKTNSILKTFDNSNIEKNIETLMINIELFEFKTKKINLYFQRFLFFFEKI